MPITTELKYWFVLLLCLLSLPVGAAGICPIERARYELMGDAKFTAGFDVKPTDANPDGELVLFVVSARSQYTYWFRLNYGNGFSTLSLTPLERPTSGSDAERFSDIQKNSLQSGDFQPIFLIDKNLSFYPPESVYPGLSAPEYLFPASLAPSLWYHSGLFGNPENTRESMLRGLFKYKSCWRN